MTHTLAKIYGKPGDYKICTECHTIVWYEATSCAMCNSEDFKVDQELFYTLLDEEYAFYTTEGYTEDEIDSIEKDVM